MTRTILSGGSVVLPHSVLETGTVVIENGLIVAVQAGALRRVAGASERHIDTSGRLVMPGCIDLHNDAIENELSPRPRAPLPPALALATLDRRLAAAGVTTEFDAIFFADMVRNSRRLDQARERVELVLDYTRSGRALVDHRVLFRSDVWVEASFESALEASAGLSRPLISLNDHTPGQGQYRDIEQFKLYHAQHLGEGADAVEERTQQQIDRARDQPEIALGVFSRAQQAVQQREIVLMSHDDDTVEKVELMYEIGVRVAEFPVTLVAAQHQHELGMLTTAGAPNVVRGGSASGNISALDLLARGYVDVLCADYHAPSLIAAALLTEQQGLLDLAGAVRLITLNPARAARIDRETGSLEAGKRADIAVVDPDGPTPLVELTLRAGEVKFYAPVRAASLAPVG